MKRRRRKPRRYYVTFADRVGVEITAAPMDSSYMLMWRYKFNPTENENVAILVEQALGELAVALGQPPNTRYEWPRPTWMPEFEWTPPLRR